MVATPAGARSASTPQHPLAHRAAGSRTALERDEPERLLAVVDRRTPLDPVDYAPRDLVRWQRTDYQLRAEVADQLSAMLRDGGDLGRTLRVISAYRSYQTQGGTYEYWVGHYGRARADATSARPGHSEHQTGLAVDLDGPGGCYLEPCFGDTDAGQWVAQEAHRFGFVMSYPRGLRARSGYSYEPWHFRYVGPQVATAMRELGVPLLSDYLRPYHQMLEVGAALGERP